MPILLRSLFSSCYNTREVKEMKAIHQIYTACLKSPAFPMLDRTPLALVNGTTNRPRQTLHQNDLIYLKPSTQADELYNLVDGGVRFIVDYLTQRRKRGYFCRGYDDDPLNLTCVTLREQFAALATVACDEGTATQIAELKDWLVKLAEQDSTVGIFTKEPQRGTHSFRHLLFNLLEVVEHLEVQVKRRLSLASSQKRFDSLRKNQQALLGSLIHYLSSVCSDRPNTGIFSITNVYSTYTTALEKQLQTREGVFLQTLLFDPKTKGLLGEVGQPALEKKGQMPVILNLSEKRSFLNLTPQEENALAVVLSLVDYQPSRITESFCRRYQLDQAALQDYCKKIKSKVDREFRDRSLGICRYLTTDSILPFIKLHGLSHLLISSCHYTEQLWALAGSQGDQLVFGKTGHAIRIFIKASEVLLGEIKSTIQTLQHANKICYYWAVSHGKCKRWQDNFFNACLLQQSLLEQLDHFELKLLDLHTFLDNKKASDQLSDLKKNQQLIDEVFDFSMYCSNQLGLSRKTIFSEEVNGLETKEVTKMSKNPPSFLPLESERPILTAGESEGRGLSYSNLLFIIQSFFTESNAMSAFADQFIGLPICQPYWFQFGMKTRKHFVHQATGIFIHYDELLLKNNLSSATQEQLEALCSRLEALKQNTEQSIKDLWWPFQRQTQTFLENGVQLIDQQLKSVRHMIQDLELKYEQEGVHTSPDNSSNKERPIQSNSLRNNLSGDGIDHQLEALKKEVEFIGSQTAALKEQSQKTQKVAQQFKEIALSLNLSVDL